MKNTAHIVKEKSFTELRILLILLAVLYGIFTITAFVKCDYLWGINFLYYLPLWQKFLFISAGGLVFLPSCNQIIYTAYTGISVIIKSVQRRTEQFFPRTLYLLVLSAGFSALFYAFHIVSLYHAPMGAIYFMQRNIPIVDYYKEWVLVEDKYTLLWLWGAFRYLFCNLLHFSPYWSLAVPSIIFGVFFVIALDFFLRKLDLQPLQQFLVLIMLFTQSITYYYFGFANYYGPVPFVIFLYLFSVVTYHKNNTALFFPLIMGMVAILTHLGALYIFPSLAFLIIQKYSTMFPRLYDLFTFRSFKKSAIIFVSILLLSYIVLNTLSLPSINLQEYTVPPLKLKRGYGWPLLSFGYFIHLLNMVMIISPPGILILMASLKYFRNFSVWGDFKYSLLWLSIGGIVYCVLLHPQTIFAWDAWGWASAGYVFLGAMLFLYSSKQVKQLTYPATVIITHALMYFTAWITLNNNIYAAVLNYLDTAETFDPQLTWCLQIMLKDKRNIIDTKQLLRELEKRAKTKDDYWQIAGNYTVLQDSSNAQYFTKIYFQFLEEAIQKEPNNAYNYYTYLNALKAINIQGNENDNKILIEQLHQKTIQLEHENIQYHVLYANFLWNKGELQRSLSLLEKADSLYGNQKGNLFSTSFSYPYVKFHMTRLNYLLGNFLETIKCFNEAVAIGASIKDNNFDKALLASIFSYVAIGNTNKAEGLLSLAHNNNIALDANLNKLVQSLIIKHLDDKNYLNFLRFLGPFSSETNKIFRISDNLEEITYQEVLPYVNNFIMQEKYDSLSIYGEQLVQCTPDLYPGYYLLGVYNKNFKKDYAAADSLFDKAIELVRRSVVIKNVDTYIKKFQEAKANR